MAAMLAGSFSAACAEQPPALAGIEELEPAIRQQIARAYEQARRHPGEAAALGKLGTIYQVYGKYELAEACFRKAIALQPREFRWSYYLGYVQGVLGDAAGAVEQLRAAIPLDPGYVPARVRLAEVLFEAGRPEEAETVCRDAVRREDRLASAHFALGKILAAKGDAAGAIACFQRACELAANFRPAHYALAMAYLKAGAPEKAQLHLARYRELQQQKQPTFDPLLDDVKALYAGGMTRFAKGSELAAGGRYEEAAAEFEAALRLNPDLVMAHIDLIAMYGRLGKDALAERHFHAAVVSDPGWVEAYYNRGMLLLGRGKKAEAAAMFRKAIAINPNYPEAQVQLGSLLENSGEIEAAAGHYRSALLANPGDRAAHYLFARNLASRGQFQEAIPHFLETIRVEDSRTPICLRGLAMAYERSGKPQEAIRYYEEAYSRAAGLGMQDLAGQVKRDLERVKEGAHP